MMMQLKYFKLGVLTMVSLHITAYNYFLKLYHVTAEEFDYELINNKRFTKAMPNQVTDPEKSADENKN